MRMMKRPPKRDPYSGEHGDLAAWGRSGTAAVATGSRCQFRGEGAPDQKAADTAGLE